MDMVNISEKTVSQNDEKWGYLIHTASSMICLKLYKLFILMFFLVAQGKQICHLGKWILAENILKFYTSYLNSIKI